MLISVYLMDGSDTFYHGVDTLNSETQEIFALERIRTLAEQFRILKIRDAITIIWKPYERLPVDFLPFPLRGPVILGMSRTILICFEKIVYHHPYLIPRQFGLKEDFECTLRDPLVEIKIITRGGPKVNRDWSKFGDYHQLNQEWERRHILLINYQVDGPNPSTTSTFEIAAQARCPQHPLPPTFVYNEWPNHSTTSTSEIPTNQPFTTFTTSYICRRKRNSKLIPSFKYRA
ncbi:hypothetical protein HYC85_024115 [Camellia sinensis]|uniref:Aminotransferase-like plant mobile domain-containing protein n=1 Tax=Camellia sinensis TaxID=4442 RepID=A0A7J7G785_CAMSI|nr:hypothetical protein HYC85_024115 [Camellia sinensis]